MRYFSAAILASVTPAVFAARGSVPGEIDAAWSQAKTSLQRYDFSIADEMRDEGIIIAKREASHSNWMSCFGRGSFIKTTLTTTLTFGKRESGQIVVDVVVTGVATWYSLGRYHYLPCTSTGELERDILADLADPVTPISVE